MFKWQCTIKNIKMIAFCAALAVFLIIPEQVLHALLVLLHLCYEMVAMVLEHGLHHAFDMNKFHSQLVVFYLSWSVVLMALYHVYRRIPGWLKQGKQAIEWQKTQWHERWQALDIWTKIKWSLFQWAGVIGLLVFMAN